MNNKLWSPHCMGFMNPMFCNLLFFFCPFVNIPTIYAVIFPAPCRHTNFMQQQVDIQTPIHEAAFWRDFSTDAISQDPSAPQLILLWLLLWAFSSYASSSSIVCLMCGDCQFERQRPCRSEHWYLMVLPSTRVPVPHKRGCTLCSIQSSHLNSWWWHCAWCCNTGPN